MSNAASMFADQMVKNISRFLRNGERVFVGLNSYIPLLGVQLAKNIHGKDIRLFTVADAYEPDLEGYRLVYSTGDHEIARRAIIHLCVESFDMVQKGMMDVMFLGPVQVDAETNMNLTAIGDYANPKVRLTGGAASAFIAPLVKRLMLWMPRHSRDSLARKVDFVTATTKNSQNEVWLFTNLCTFRYNRQRRSWMLVEYNPWTNIDDILSKTAFEFEVSESVKKSEEVTDEERAYIASLDVEGLRLKPFYRT
ncbi:MAG: CoA-transferase [Candidatus Caldarchaeum sp.]